MNALFLYIDGHIPYKRALGRIFASRKLGGVVGYLDTGAETEMVEMGDTHIVEVIN